MTPLSGDSNLEPWSSLDRSGGGLPEAAGREKYFVLIGGRENAEGGSWCQFHCVQMCREPLSYTLESS